MITSSTESLGTRGFSWEASCWAQADDGQRRDEPFHVSSSIVEGTPAPRRYHLRFPGGGKKSSRLGEALEWLPFPWNHHRREIAMRRSAAVLSCAVMVLAGSSMALAQAPGISTAGPTDIAAGKRVFDAQCAWCHGTGGAGGSGSTLRGVKLRHAATDAALIDILKTGIAGTEMPGFALSLTNRTAWQTAAYVRTLGSQSPQPVPGSPERGATVYDARNCSVCHIVGGRGAGLGPELTMIGAYEDRRHSANQWSRPKPLVAGLSRRAGIDPRRGRDSWHSRRRRCVLGPHSRRVRHPPLLREEGISPRSSRAWRDADAVVQGAPVRIRIGRPRGLSCEFTGGE